VGTLDELVLARASAAMGTPPVGGMADLALATGNVNSKRAP
jgi:hypothetical protein